MHLNIISINKGVSKLKSLVTEDKPVNIDLRKKRFLGIAWKQRYLYIMSLPFVIWLIIFSYVPIWGWIMAFQNYKPGRAFLSQKWVGLDNFVKLFTDERFYQVMRNTLAMSSMGLIVGFTVPITFAILLNEIQNKYYKRTVQTISYLPHFISWVVAAGLISQMLSNGGIINQILKALHLTNESVQFLAKGNLFWFIVTIADMWKETGWNAIIYLAAIAGIDAELFQASQVDGANRLQRIWHIILPGIRPTIVILFIMSIGNLIRIGFEKQFLLGNALVLDYSEVLDIYVINYGINLTRYSFGTAIGVFNSVVSIVLLVSSNKIFKKITGESVY
jgi:putative aldouronate transport system permease protein